MTIESGNLEPYLHNAETLIAPAIRPRKVAVTSLIQIMADHGDRIIDIVGLPDQVLYDAEKASRRAAAQTPTFSLIRLIGLAVGAVGLLVAVWALVRIFTNGDPGTGLLLLFAAFLIVSTAAGITLFARGHINAADDQVKRLAGVLYGVGEINVYRFDLGQVSTIPRANIIDVKIGEKHMVEVTIADGTGKQTAGYPDLREERAKAFATALQKRI